MTIFGCKVWGGTFEIEITTQLQLKQNNLNKIEAADKRVQCKYRVCVAAGELCE